ncbi:MAG: hypothetical protein AMS15_03495 [Planctomycetes bacterium DG_23]|nr:MAG: hypothetical protein AMS15_03495 [Planctomycetes bacterium DG_23]
MCLKSKKFVFIILALGLALRLIFISLLPASELFLPGPLADQKEFVAMAENVLAGRGIILGEGREIARMPLYALFLALSFGIFGENFFYLRLWQALISMGSVGLVFLLAKRIFSREAGLVAALLAAIYPFFILFSGLVLNETLFIFFFLLEIYLLVRLKETVQAGEEERGRSRTYFLAVAAGVCAGATVLIRGAALVFYVFVWAFSLLLARPKKRILLAVGIHGVIFCATLFPWVWRNYEISGHFVPTTLRVGLSLYEGNSPQATGAPILNILVIPDAARDLDEYEKDKFLRREATRYILEHPGRFLRLCGMKFIRFWNPVPNYPGFRRLLIIIGTAGSFLPVVFLALLGMGLERRDWRKWFLVVSPVVYFTLLHMVFVGSLRYRVPVMPFLVVLAGAGGWRIIQGLKKKQGRDE